MTTQTMHAVLWQGPDALRETQVDRPTRRPGEAIVKIEISGLCGTDFSILHGTHPRATAPLIIGHEITGRVVDTDAASLLGRRVAVLPLISCGECVPCRAGLAHVCERLGLFGIDKPGALAEYAAFPVERLVPVSDNVPLRAAGLIEPLAVAVHAVARSGLAGGETVAVFGAGPIGILTALVARHAGAARIVVVEPSAERRAAAEALGFIVVPASDDSSTVVRETLGGGAQLVFDTAAHPSVTPHLTRTAAVRGTIVVVGVYKRPTEVDLQTVTFTELTLIGVRVYTADDFRDAVALVESGALGLDRLPVAVFGLDAVPAAFEAAASAGAALKVFVAANDDARAEVQS